MGRELSAREHRAFRDDSGAGWRRSLVILYFVAVLGVIGLTAQQLHAQGALNWPSSSASR